MRRTLLFAGLLLALAVPTEAARSTASARQAYDRALARERTLTARATPSRPAPVSQIRAAIARYESLVRRYPRSGYSDNALWQAAGLATQLFERSADETDRRTAARLLRQIISGYPSSSLVAGAKARLSQLDPPRREARAGPRRSPSRAATPVRTAAVTTTPAAAIPAGGSGAPADAPSPAASAPATAAPLSLTAVHRTVLGDFVRLIIELSGEARHTEGRLDAPRRVYFDIENTVAPSELADKSLTFADDVGRQVRVGRRSDDETRVAIDLEGVSKFTVFKLYDPYRLVVDLERSSGHGAVSEPRPTAPADVGTLVASDEPASPVAPPPAPIPAPPAARPAARAVPPISGLPLPDDVLSAPARAVAAKAPARSDPAPEAPPLASLPAAPLPPAANAAGGLSVARQLGLGISRIVIDPGHGGHDPGAMGRRITEAELVLDVALRLEKLLKSAGYAVVMTRRDDRFIPLEQRTAMANRELADLFLSIHANAGRNPQARGVETYFLNFATNPDAIAVAARENASSAQAMHNLPDIVRAITLNTKIDESRDFAIAVQKSMVKRLRAQNPQLRDLGVKQAPFVVLIGATMPSVLAEISFITHTQEGALLRTSSYRDRIAEALFDAVAHYQRSLKSVGAVAALPE